MKLIVVLFALLCAACIVGAIAAEWTDLDDIDEEEKGDEE